MGEVVAWKKSRGIRAGLPTRASPSRYQVATMSQDEHLI